MNNPRFIEQFRELLTAEKASTGIALAENRRSSYSSLTESAIQALLLAAKCLEPNEVYCEICTEPNLNLIDILTDQLEVMAYSVVNSNALENSSPIESFWEKALAADLAERVMLCQQSPSDFFKDLRSIESEDKVGLLFYDDALDYRSQLLTLLLAQPFLADQSLIIVNQGHWSAAQQASLDFMQIHPQCQLLFEGTSDADLPDWNGLQIFIWDAQVSSDRSDLKSTCSEELVHSLVAVQQQDHERTTQKWLLTLEHYIGTNQHQLASQVCNLLLRWQPESAALWLQQAKLFFQQGLVDQAQIAATQSRERAVHETDVGILQELGQILRAKGLIPDTEATFLALIHFQPENASFYRELGFINLLTARYDQASALFRQALDLDPTDEDACHLYLNALIGSGQFYQALQEQADILRVFPESLRLKLQLYLALPALYQDSQEIVQARQRFTLGLSRLIEETRYETEAQLDLVFFGLGFTTNFYLAYQNQNDRDLQAQYGQFVHKIVSARYPHWVTPRMMPDLAPGERIRVGYVSRFMHWHTVSKLFSNWIIELDKSRYEVFVYYLDTGEDAMTQRLRMASDRFTHLSCGLEDSAQQILGDQLQVLVYFDLGMNPETTLLAALRLAPVQCLAWGHPVTSGLPTLDYFLSSELMEPEEAQDHYTETLVCLPNLSIAYPPPDIPVVQQPRSEMLPFISETDVVYLSCQSLFKYLPQYDFVFPAIAEKLPQAKFVFLSHFSRNGNEIFEQRLQKAFVALGLKYDEHCLILKRQNQDFYLALNQISDIYLDTFAWSGGNSTLEAVACGIPIVTCPGQFMRGRHSAAILNQLRVSETIAKDEQEYIEIAVRLGLDPDWRKQVVDKMRQNQSRLYNDRAAIRGLETFYKKVVQDHLV